MKNLKQRPHLKQTKTEIYRSSPDQLQFNFDLPPTARKTDPATSHAAAARIKTGSRRHEVLGVFKTYGQTGATSLTVANILNRQRDSISPHIKPLILLGYLERTGLTEENTQTGNQCELYRYTGKQY